MQSQLFYSQNIEEDFSILLNNVNFQIIKRNFFYKIILMEACPAVAFKLGDSGVQPEGFSQVELQADLIQCVEYFVGTCFLASVFDDGIFYHSVVFPFFGP